VLIGYWPLNETEGDTAYDYSGNENHGSLEGSPTQGVDGVVGQNAMDFEDGDYVDPGITAGDIISDDKISISVWVYPKAGNRGYQDIVFGNNDSGDNRWDVGWSGEGGVNLGSSEDNSFMFANHGDSSINTATQSAYFPDNWYHVVWTYTQDGNQRIFVDGKLIVDEHNNDYPIGGTDSIMIAGNGRYEDFVGVLQGLRIYNRVLSSAEVQYLYSVGRRGRFSSRKKSL